MAKHRTQGIAPKAVDRKKTPDSSQNQIQLQSPTQFKAMQTLVAKTVARHGMVLVSTTSVRIAFATLLSVTLQQLVNPPKAAALSFTSNAIATNPYYFNGSGGSASNWTLYYPDGDTDISGDWGNATCNAEIPSYPCVVLKTDPTSIAINSGDDDGTSTYWASSIGSNPQGYRVAFTGQYTADITGGGTAGYAVVSTMTNIDAVTFTPLGSNTPAPSTFIASNQFIVFKISNDTSPGVLNVNNFSYSPVPSPLPAAGAATAFGFSRRLRRRCKGKVDPRRVAAPNPLHPCSYLNLPPAALTQRPISFSYPSASASGYPKASAQPQASMRLIKTTK